MATATAAQPGVGDRSQPGQPANRQVLPARPEPPRRNRRLGTAARLGLLQAGVLAVILSAVVLSLVRTFASQSHSTTTHLLTAEVEGYQRSANTRGDQIGLRPFSRSYLRTHALPDGQVIVIGFPGQSALGSSNSATFAASPAIESMLGTPLARSAERSLRVGATTYEVLAVPVHAGQAQATFIVAAAQDQVRENESRVLHLALIEALIALLAGAFAGYLLLRGLLRRIGRITETAAGLGQGEMDRRLGDQGTDDEVGKLAATFDSMADRVAAAMATQRSQLADVSHQLRTPLTVARGHLEVLGRTGTADPQDVHETIAVVVDEIDHMTALVERLLMLGRALEPDFVEPAPIDLRSMVIDLFATAQVLADRDWRLGDVPDLTLHASLDKLRGALLNLLDNAVNATGPGDQIALAARLRADGWVELVVSDSGPGIPADRRHVVLDRFSRPDAGTTRGSGLGLAIVKAVAEGHGGHVEVTDSTFGGARIAIVLPPTIVTSGAGS